MSFGLVIYSNAPQLTHFLIGHLALSKGVLGIRACLSFHKKVFLELAH